MSTQAQAQRSDQVEEGVLDAGPLQLPERDERLLGDGVLVAEQPVEVRVGQVVLAAVALDAETLPLRGLPNRLGKLLSDLRHYGIDRTTRLRSRSRSRLYVCVFAEETSRRALCILRWGAA